MPSGIYVSFTPWFDEDVPALNLPPLLSAILAIQSAVAGPGAVPMDKNLCEPEPQSDALVDIADVEINFGGSTSSPTHEPDAGRLFASSANVCWKNVLPRKE